MNTLKLATCLATASCGKEAYDLWGWPGVVVAGIGFAGIYLIWWQMRRKTHDA